MEKLKTWTSSNLETNNTNNNNNSTIEMSESMSHHHNHHQNTPTVAPASQMDSNSQIKCLVVASTTPDGKQISSIYKDIKVSKHVRGKEIICIFF